jgi:hypothetical protein
MNFRPKLLKLNFYYFSAFYFKLPFVAFLQKKKLTLKLAVCPQPGSWNRRPVRQLQKPPCERSRQESVAQEAHDEEKTSNSASQKCQIRCHIWLTTRPTETGIGRRVLCNVRQEMQMLLPDLPRASRARKAFFHVPSANQDARSAGDDSSARLLTPFLRCRPRSQNMRILVSQQSGATYSMK